MAENEMNESPKMTNAKAWTIISVVAIAVGIIIAGTMFFLGMAVGQNSARTEALENCECEDTISS